MNMRFSIKSVEESDLHASFRIQGIRFRMSSAHRSAVDWSLCRALPLGIKVMIEYQQDLWHRNLQNVKHRNLGVIRQFA
jgi:uncharacterized glyoxalase superfamily protein PhnB